MSTEKRQVRTKKLLESAGVVMVEPTINPLDYKASLIRLLNYCNVSLDDKTRRKWIQTYIKKTNNKDYVKLLTKASDFEIRQVAVLCHMVNTDQYISEFDQARIDNFFKMLESRIEIVKEKKVTPTKPVVSVQDRIVEAAKTHIAEVEAEIDVFTKNKKSDFSMKSYLLANNVSGAVAKKVGEYFTKTLTELRELVAGKDKQLVEGYSQFKKVEQRRFVTFVEAIVNDCLQQVVNAKSTRKPRAKKTVAPGKVVAKLQYASENTELKIKSVNPTALVNCNEAWIYNTKTRKLNVYRAVANEQMTVKGTTLLNYDITKSIIIHLRKPDEFFKDIVIGKRALTNKIKSMKSSAVKTGRINSDCIILGVF